MATRANGVTVKEAAESLGITESAVRLRPQHRTLRSYRADGRVYGILPEEHEGDSRHNGVSNFVSSDVSEALNALVEQLRSEITLIREQLRMRVRRIAELHALLQTARWQLVAGAPVPRAGDAAETLVPQSNNVPDPPQRVSAASASMRGRRRFAQIFGAA